MPRTKVMLPEGFVKEYRKCQSVKQLAKMYNVSQETVKARLIEKGAIIVKRGKRDSFRRVPSAELLEKRKMNTIANNKHFAKTNIKGKKAHSSRLSSVGHSFY